MPGYSAAEIEELLINNPYDVKILSQLESYVLAQTKNPAAYDFDANRHLLKLYTADPDAIKMDMVQKVLVLALMHLPHPHFLACTYLLREDIHDDDHLKGIFKLSALLEHAQFPKFWKEAKESKLRAVLEKCVGFDDAIRDFICSIVQSTYQSISMSLLKDLLHTTQENVDKIVKGQGWTRGKEETTGKCVVFIPVNEGNQITEVKTTEKIPLAEICKFMSLAKCM